MEKKPTPHHRYDDIIHLPHHRSATRAPMSGEERAAQFAPFAALTGHEDAIRETARLTAPCAELAEDRRESIDRTLRFLMAHWREHPNITVTYFAPDGKKSGGAYIRIAGRIAGFRENPGTILMEDQTVIPTGAIYDISCP